MVAHLRVNDLYVTPLAAYRTAPPRRGTDSIIKPIGGKSIGIVKNRTDSGEGPPIDGPAGKLLATNGTNFHE